MNSFYFNKQWLKYRINLQNTFLVSSNSRDRRALSRKVICERFVFHSDRYFFDCSYAFFCSSEIVPEFLGIFYLDFQIFSVKPVFNNKAMSGSWDYTEDILCDPRKPHGFSFFLFLALGKSNTSFISLMLFVLARWE